MELTKILSEAEEIELRKIASNEAAMAALKKVLLFSIYYAGTLEAGQAPEFQRNFVFSLLLQPNTGQEYKLTNEELGEKLRARIEGVIMLDDGFKQLETFKPVKAPEKQEDNPAR